MHCCILSVVGDLHRYKGILGSLSPNLHVKSAVVDILPTSIYSNLLSILKYTPHLDIFRSTQYTLIYSPPQCKKCSGRYTPYLNIFQSTQIYSNILPTSICSDLLNILEYTPHLNVKSAVFNVLCILDSLKASFLL